MNLIVATLFSSSALVLVVNGLVCTDKVFKYPVCRQGWDLKKVIVDDKKSVVKLSRLIMSNLLGQGMAIPTYFGYQDSTLILPKKFKESGHM
ncbi:hypothetical protein MJO28_017369 [Puccinia striiformis f. sp. tritici]|nr:hypothetical protein MJO28_017369 [Puccinia striiformis f. sp. tritici]